MSTDIYIPRITYTRESTTGLVVVDGEPWGAFTLEDRVRLSKLSGVTAIPAGTYKLDHRASPKFKREMIWLRNVPGFQYVYVHSGNKPEDTEGCIMVARTRPVLDKILGDSFSLERKLFKHLEVQGWRDCWLTISNGPGYSKAVIA